MRKRSRFDEKSMLLERNLSVNPCDFSQINIKPDRNDYDSCLKSSCVTRIQTLQNCRDSDLSKREFVHHRFPRDVSLPPTKISEKSDGAVECGRFH